MKTNKFWSIIMMLVIVLGSMFVFSSCGDDEEDAPENAIVGTWTHVEYPVQGSQDDWSKIIVTINNDGTGYAQEIKHYHDGREKKEEYGFTYTVEGNNIYVTTEDGEHFKEHHFEINGNKLILTNGSEKIEFTKS